VNGRLLTPTLSSQAGGGTSKPLAPREREEGGARVSRRVRGGLDLNFGGFAMMLLVLSLALAGCGKRNAPIPPPDEPNTYPRPYPSE
jgi:hypothetical protein